MLRRYLDTYLLVPGCSLAGPWLSRLRLAASRLLKCWQLANRKAANESQNSKRIAKQQPNRKAATESQPNRNVANESRSSRKNAKRQTHRKAAIRILIDFDTIFCTHLSASKTTSSEKLAKTHEPVAAKKHPAFQKNALSVPPTC